MTQYRERIYKKYVNARQESLSPQTIDGLKPRAPYLKKIIKDHFPVKRDVNILDLGCGHGALIYFAKQFGYVNVRGVDCSEEQVFTAKSLGMDGVKKGDLVEELKKSATESADIVITFDIIEHFTKDEFILFLDEVYRVLKKNGKWIIHCPNGESPFANKILFGDFTHELAFTRTSIAQVLLSSGFCSVSSYEDKPIVHGLKSLIRKILWEILRGFLRFYLAIESGSGEKECIFSQNFLTVAIK